MRCTYQLKDNHYRICNEIDGIKKLGQLEDIEDELGIDLLVREQALRNGFYYIDEQGNIVHVINYLSNRSYGFICAEYEYISYYEVCLNELRKECNFYYKDYGKTWALTEKELKNE